MITRNVPAWFTKAREIAARFAPPGGQPFSAAKKGETAELYLYDAIGKDPWSGTGIDPQDVVKEIQAAKGSDALNVHLNSPGGFVFDGIAIYNAIRAFDGPRTVYVEGLAASIASVIALAGDEVVTNEGGTWMIHDPMGGLFSWGTADQIEDDARKTIQPLRKIRETLIDIYVTQTGRSISEVSAWMSAETWMTADEAKERGFTDEVVKQERAPEPDARVAAKAPAFSMAEVAKLSPRVAAELARARVAHRLPGAGPGSPGRPGK
jgi:ATP-dependent Clp protease protease subunit